jgi:zinc transporter, ZIP family
VPAELLLFAAGSGTALATGIGAVPVYLLGEGVGRVRPAMWGLAAGLMVAASVLGLLLPALERGSRADVALGLGLGAAFLLGTRALLARRDVHVGALRGAGVRRSVLVFAVLLAHSLPEGFAIGTAFAADPRGLGVFVLLAIALQNVPEGTSVAIPMQAGGFGARAQVVAAVMTSAPQPFGAVVAYLLVEQVTALLPVSFAFAAGAMLVLVAVELAPQCLARGARTPALAGASAGLAVMVGLSALVGA